jgi:phospholipase/carboxylesterase
MRIETWGGLKLRITGGDDREGGGAGPVVVLLHGFGAPGEDLVSLWRVLDVPRGTRFVFPEGLLDLGGPYAGGRAWWNIDMARLEQSIARGETRDMTQQVPEGLTEAREHLLAMLVTLDEKLTPSKLVLGGFSQGAMLSCDVALRTERALAGLILLSGTFLAEAEWSPLMPSRNGLPVFMSHGRADRLLPFALSELLRDRLTTSGLDVTWQAFNGGHEIPSGVLDGVGAFLRKVL